MKPPDLNLEIYQGSTYRKNLQWIVKSTGLPKDLTGCTVKMQMRAYLGSETVIDELSTENGKIVLTDASQGKFQIILTPAQTVLYTFSKSVYDLDITFPVGDKYTLVKGTVTLYLQVTE